MQIGVLLHMVNKDTSEKSVESIAAISIHILLDHLNLLAINHTRNKLSGPVSEILTLLRAVDSIQPNLLLGKVLENGDGITIGDSEHFQQSCNTGHFPCLLPGVHVR